MITKRNIRRRRGRGRVQGIYDEEKRQQGQIWSSSSSDKMSRGDRGGLQRGAMHTGEIETMMQKSPCMPPHLTKMTIQLPEWCNVNFKVGW